MGEGPVVIVLVGDGDLLAVGVLVLVGETDGDCNPVGVATGAVLP